MLNEVHFAIIGTSYHTPVCGEFERREDTLICVDNEGVINYIVQPEQNSYNDLCSKLRNADKLVELSENQYLLPGLVDLHIHAPQWPQMGKALNVPLANWLQDYTFPLEAKFSDMEFAKQVYNSLVENLIANGTTSALYFGTVHLQATKLLADICLAKGQRGFVGKVAMDNTAECPDYYRDESTSSGIEDTRAFIEYVKNMDGNELQLVKPVVTPRFLPSCTDEMLQGLGELVREHDCHVQSHCSESDWVQSYGIERFGQSDTKTYRDFGLLTDKTVLAHSNFMSDEDLDIMKKHKSGIGHCPLSNSYFSNAVFHAREALDKGVDVGLGTDIAAGPSPSIFNSCVNAVNVSRMREDGVNATIASEVRGQPNSRIDFMEAFWMATAGGGKALDSKIGLLEVGYAFDAIVVETNLKDSDLIVWPELDHDIGILQKIVYGADRHAIQKVWINGNLVVSKSKS